MASPTIYFDLGNTLIFGPANNRQPYSDAVATLVELYERGYLLGLLSDQATGTTVADVRARLQQYGFDPYIEPITISSELPGNQFKPDPDIFALALQKAGHTAASVDTAFVTETWSHIEAARNLGWRGILKTNGAACSPGSEECVPDLNSLLDLFPALAIDLYFRDALDDPGEDLYPGQRFWDSPDLWIRNDADGGTTHQSPEYGQDNWFHARIHNRGVGIARRFQVSFEVKTWVGSQFVFPADYLPAIALADGENLRPGDDTVLTARWPAGAVPATGTHGCWISAIFTDRDTTPANRHGWEHNNLAQKNLTIVDLVPGDSTTVWFHLGTRLSRIPTAARLEVHRPRAWTQVPVALVHRRPAALAKMWASFTQTTEPTIEPMIELLSATRIRIAESAQSSSLRLDLAPHSKVGLAGTAAEKRPAWLGRRVEATLLGRYGAAEIHFAAGTTAGFPVVVPPGGVRAVGARITAPTWARAGQTFVVDLVERDTDDNAVGGVAVRVRVR